MSSLLALPPPSAFSGATAPSALARARKLLASDALPVTPIHPIPDEARRRRQAEGQVEETDGRERQGQSEAIGERGPSGVKGGGETFSLGANGGESGAGSSNGANPLSGAPVSAGRPSAGFVTQSIAQEAIGNGLHIEPWANAIDAYRRADAGVRGRPAGLNV